MGLGEDEQLDRLLGTAGTDEVGVDPTTPLESLFAAPLMISVAGLSIGVLWYFILVSGVKIDLPHTAFGLTPGSLIFLSLLVMPVGVFLVKQIDIHYRFHMPSEEVVLYRRVFGYESRSRVCAFSDVHGLALDTKTERQGDEKHRRLIYRYGLIMVLKSGRQIRLIDPVFQRQDLVCERGRGLARSMGVEFHSGHGDLSVRRTRQGLRVSSAAPSRLSCFERLQGGCLLLFCLVLILAAGMKWWDENVSPIMPKPGPKAERALPTKPSLWAIEPGQLVVSKAESLSPEVQRLLVRSIYNPAAQANLAIAEGTVLELLDQKDFDFTMKDGGAKRVVKFGAARVRVSEGAAMGKVGWSVVWYNDPKLYKSTILVNQPPRDLDELKRRALSKKGVDLTVEVMSNEHTGTPQGDPTLQILVINRGGVAVKGKVHVKVRLADKPLKEMTVSGTFRPSGALATPLTIPRKSLGKGAKLTVVVDPENKYHEVNEKNNSSEVWIDP